ncbi:unnamed protein product [Clavelina lepadiformis]|uniref:Sulfotransferase n=1 Tax=Clavelina lepadiformis TaxID=159417 RepID=A0ABP0G3V4_CLALP
MVSSFRITIAVLPFIVLLSVCYVIMEHGLTQIENGIIRNDVESFQIHKNPKNKQQTQRKEEDNVREQAKHHLWKQLVESCENKTLAKYLPRIIGIGVEKCGTGALYQFLDHHPFIRTSSNIEAHYFDFVPEADRAENLHIYLDRLPLAEPHAYVFEKSPAYFSFPPDEIPAMIKKVVPEAKILLILCEPVARVLSDFEQHVAVYKKRGKHPKIKYFQNADEYVAKYLPIVNRYIGKWDEKEALAKSQQLLYYHKTDFLTGIITTGLYALHLKRWFQHYDQSNLMVIDGEDLFNDPGSVVEDVQEFVGLPKVLLKEDYVRDPETGFFCYKDWTNNDNLVCLKGPKQRTRNGNKSLNHVSISELKYFYESHNEALFSMIGRRLKWG